MHPMAEDNHCLVVNQINLENSTHLIRTTSKEVKSKYRVFTSGVLNKSDILVKFHTYIRFDYISKTPSKTTYDISMEFQIAYY